ncbi:MAG: hypothetical protein AAFR27_08280, partial [Pseudomonadota bacterium]
MIQHDAVEAGQLDDEQEAQQFIYAALYDHRLTNGFWPFGENGESKVIISNGFLGSHAYNNALVLLHSDDDETIIQSRLRYNFKRFFAEVLLNEKNMLIGRAFLIEALAYEEPAMVTLFNDIKADQQLNDTARQLALAMQGIISKHELAHYFMHRNAQETVAKVASMFSGELGKRYQALLEADGDQTISGAGFAEEFLCDCMAAHLTINDPDSDFWSTEDRHRMTYMAFAIL